MALNSRRLYVPSVLALLAAGGLAFVASSRVWTRGTVSADGLPSDAITLSGSAAHPLVGALAIVVVTAALAVLATGGPLRRAVGVVTVVASLTALWVIVTGGDTVERAFADAVAQSPAFTGQNTPDMARQVVWPALSALAFASAAALGLLTAVAGGTWSTMGSRYERRVEAAPAAPATEADIWKALDEGRDPTE